MKILFITRDGAPFICLKAAHDAITRLATQAGTPHQIHVVAEGRSMRMWMEAGINILGGMPVEGSFDPKTLSWSDINVARVLDEVCPEAVVIGLSKPINLEMAFATEALRRKIRVIAVEDTWGAHKRLGDLKVSTLLTIDREGIREAKENGYAPGSVFTIGSPVAEQALNVLPDPIVNQLIEDSGATRVAVLAGQGDGTLEMVQGMVEVVKADTANRWLLIPRFHPKNDVPGNPIHEGCRAALATLPQEQVLWTDPKTSITSIIACPGVTEVVSMFSGALLEAVALGVPAVSWTSEAAKQRIIGEFGRDYYPPTRTETVLAAVNEWGYLELLGNEGDLKTQVQLAGHLLLADGRSGERIAQHILRITG